MVTLKQIEALCSIAQLGTFERAAKRLNTTQSAVSKRIQELETTVGFQVFDRSQRGARLTEKGECLLSVGQEMISLQNQIIELNLEGANVARRIRLGITELSALTWLPRLISTLRESHPTLVVEPDVGTARELYARLQDDELDVIVIPEVFASPDMNVVRLAEVSNVWVARPCLVDTSCMLRLEELSKYLILVQGRRSGSGMVVNRWLKSQGIEFPRMLQSDNLTVVLAMAVAGLGVGYLPVGCFQPLLDEGKLVVVRTTPSLPVVPYAAMFHNDRPSALIKTVVEVTRRLCDFSHQLQV